MIEIHPAALCMYCGYSLQELPEAKCPECGQSFDPDNIDSYYHPFIHGKVRMRPAFHISSVSLVIGLVIFAILLCWAAGSNSSIGMFMDGPSMFVTTGGTLALVIATFGWLGIRNAWFVLTSRNPTPARIKDAVGVYKLAATYSLGTGFVGTIMGLVLMLANLDNPNSIGPGMAIALLTQLYGVMQAMVCVVFAVFCSRKTHQPPEVNPEERPAVGVALPATAAASATGTMTVLLGMFVMITSMSELKRDVRYKKVMTSVRNALPHNPPTALNPPAAPTTMIKKLNTLVIPSEIAEFGEE